MACMMVVSILPCLSLVTGLDTGTRLQASHRVQNGNKKWKMEQNKQQNQTKQIIELWIFIIRM
jgi:hypothetical protein